MGSQNWWVPRAQVASRHYFGAIFGHFWPFLALLAPFLTPFGHLDVGATTPSGSGPPFVGVKWSEESKLVGPEDPSDV